MKRTFIVEVNECYEKNMEEILKDAIYYGFNCGDIETGEVTAKELKKCVINHSEEG